MPRVWWVNQKQTYRHERAGGYLWSPKTKSNGQRNPYYDSMRVVAPGDFILSYVDAQITAVSTAASFAYEFPKPDEFGNAGLNWNNIGWRVDVVYTDLARPIRPRDHLALLRPLLPSKYSPLSGDGYGRQNMYLTLLPDPLAAALLDIAGVPNQDQPPRSQHDGDLIDRTYGETVRVDSWEAAIAEGIQADPQLPETEKQRLIQSRLGQGTFRRSLMKIETRCRLTNVENAEHLVASHCKPWRTADNNERLDGENGLLLVPSVDHLFDRGFISFESNGELLISPVADRVSLQRMGIPAHERTNVGNFTSGQKTYLEYHREKVFKFAKHLAEAE